MIDNQLIELHIRRANLQRTAAMGELIGSALAAAWSATKPAGAFIVTCTESLIRRKDLTSPPPRL